MLSTVTDAQICNMSMDLLLQTPEEEVVDLTNPTNDTDKLCKRWYDPTRRAVLRKRVWNFAKRRKVLTANASETRPLAIPPITTCQMTMYVWLS